MISDGMLLVAKLVATKSILLPILWWQKKFWLSHIGDRKISIVTSLTIENF
jgi:hypothetical protein